AGQVTGQLGNPMPLVFPVLGACINRGADHWSAFDAPVGLLAPCKTLAPLSQRRDGGVPRRPGGLPHNFRSIANSGKTSGIGLASHATKQARGRGVGLSVERRVSRGESVGGSRSPAGWGAGREQVEGEVSKGTPSPDPEGTPTRQLSAVISTTSPAGLARSRRIFS